MNRRGRYRRSPHVACYWAAGRAVAVNYATGAHAVLTPLTYQTLDCCGEWRTAAEVQRSLELAIPSSTVRELLQSMTDAGLCERSSRRRAAREAAMDGWASWNPAAGLFHTASRANEYGDPGEFERKLRHKVRRWPMPAAVKSPERSRITLPPVCQSVFGTVLRDRRTWRQFGQGAVTRQQLAAMLRWTSGITHWMTLPQIGKVALTSSPSGGARHPIETYVAVRRVDGVRSGLYRYLPDRHELGLIRRTTTAADVRSFLPRQPWFAGASFVIFFTAVFARTRWRYEFPRAYRAVLLEAGHVCQTFLLSATSLGLAPFSTVGINDTLVEKALGIDGISEAVLYAAGAGTRPHSAPRVVMPGHMRPATVVPNKTRDTDGI